MRPNDELRDWSGRVALDEGVWPVAAFPGSYEQHCFGTPNSAARILAGLTQADLAHAGWIDRYPPKARSPCGE
jgi:hypothetical protein